MRKKISIKTRIFGKFSITTEIFERVFFIKTEKRILFLQILIKSEKENFYYKANILKFSIRKAIFEHL